MAFRILISQKAKGEIENVNQSIILSNFICQIQFCMNHVENMEIVKGRCVLGEELGFFGAPIFMTNGFHPLFHFFFFSNDKFVLVVGFTFG